MNYTYMNDLFQDEISEFLGGILSQTTAQYIETPEASDAELKKKPKRRVMFYIRKIKTDIKFSAHDTLLE